MTKLENDLTLTKMPHPDITFGLAFIKGNVDTDGTSLFNVTVDDLCAMTASFPRCEVTLEGEPIGLVCMTDDLRPVVIFRPEHHGTDHPAIALNTYLKEFSHLPNAKPYALWSSSILPFKQCRRIVLLPTRTVNDEVQIHRNLDLPLARVAGNMFNPKGVIRTPSSLPKTLKVMTYHPGTNEIGVQDSNVPAGHMYHVKLRNNKGEALYEENVMQTLENFKPMTNTYAVVLNDDLSIANLFVNIPRGDQ